MKTIMTITLLSICTLVHLSGCSYSRYPTADISTNSSLAHLDINSLPFYKVKLEYRGKEIEALIESGVENKELKDYINEIKAGTDQEITYDYLKENLKVTAFYYPGIKDIELPDNKTYSMPYIRESKNEIAAYILVEFPNGQKYRALLDTGMGTPVFLTSDIVLKNKLAILPNKINDNGIKSNGGLCHIPQLNFGSAKMIDALASYEQQQWQFRILNIPLDKHSDIILGRQFIRSFDYVMFDNVNKEVVFSKDGTFKPDNPSLWTSYTFSTIEEGGSAGTIMVDIPVASKVLTVAFDTGAGGLLLNKKHWLAVEQDMEVKQLRESKFLIYNGTSFPCQIATVSKLQIANTIHENAVLEIDNNPDNLSIFGFGYFQDTAVVLDFVNKLFWIKKTK